jgi:hypothetical protein
MEEPDQPDGTESWRDAEGRLHREDGPAWACWLTHPNGVRYTEEKWYRHGVLHRMGAPARIKTCRGEIYAASWWLDGQLHRNDGPAKTGQYGDCWFRHGKPHRDEGPARQFGESYYAWYIDGKLHRVEGPARIRYGRPKEIIEESWWQQGRLHRLDGPARVIFGEKQWCQRGKLHREDGPALVKKDGTEKWYRHGQLHRENGPAATYPHGSCEYWRYGKLHRHDGPAVELAEGFVISHSAAARFRIYAREIEFNTPTHGHQTVYKKNEYWIAGRQLSEEEFFARRDKKQKNNLRFKRPK